MADVWSFAIVCLLKMAEHPNFLSRILWTNEAPLILPTTTIYSLSKILKLLYNQNFNNALKLIHVLAFSTIVLDYRLNAELCATFLDGRIYEVLEDTSLHIWQKYGNSIMAPHLIMEDK